MKVQFVSVTVRVLAVSLLFAFASAPAHAAIHTIQISNFTFTPKNTLVNPGDTVRWAMVGGVHSTTSDPSSPKAWDSGIFPVGSNFDLVFSAGDGPGPFPYHCSVHSLSMKDTIFVAPISYTCGDPNVDAAVNIADAVYVLNYVFKGGPPPMPVIAAGDVNCDISVNIADAVYLINFIFKGGQVPCANCP